jgi:hypothetical protein
VLLIPAGVALGLPAAAYGSCSDVLSLTPATQTAAPGGSVTVTATLTCGGAPVSGQGVSFYILTGPDQNFQASGTTGSTGQASFTVQNTGGGIDVGEAKTTTTPTVVFAERISIYWENASLSTPSQALPGQVVSFTGSGYAAGETVNLYAGEGPASGQLVTTVQADSTGGISGSFTVSTVYMISLEALGATSGNQGWAAFTQPCTDTWANPVSGNWNTTADWSAGKVPTDVAGPACITEPGNYTVTTGGASVTSLILGAPSGSTVQTLDVVANSANEPPNASLGFDYTSYVNKTGALVLDSATDDDTYLGAATLVVKGLLTTVQGGGGIRDIEGDLTISGGRVRIGAADTYDSDSTIDNNGTLSVDAGDNLNLFDGASYSQGAAGRLNVVVDATKDAAYGLIGPDEGSGKISLGGTLGVTTYGTPSAGQSFTVISGTSVTGTFSLISSSVSYTPAYSPTAVTLTH